MPSSIPWAENSESRVQGFEAWCAENAPGIEIVKVNDAGDTTAATDNMSAALQANDDLVGLFCVDGIAGTAGPTAVAESGKICVCWLSTWTPPCWTK